MKSETQLLSKSLYKRAVGSPFQCDGLHDLNLYRCAFHSFVVSFFQQATNVPLPKPYFVHGTLGEFFNACMCELRQDTYDPKENIPFDMALRLYFYIKCIWFHCSI